MSDEKVSKLKSMVCRVCKNTFQYRKRNAKYVTGKIKK